VHVDVYLEVNQLQRHTFQLPAGYYPSPKRILKAIEGKKHRTIRTENLVTWLRLSPNLQCDLRVGILPV
jgi:hypothetical protein